MRIDCEQLSTEWMLTKHGKVTGSRIAEALAVLTRKSGEAACRFNYKIELVSEILTGRSTDKYVSKEMDWGIENEPFARALYEIRHDVTVEQVGFYVHPTIERSGASPDGLVGDDGMAQIKCPNTTTHLVYMLANEVPEEYQPQMLWEMACAERQWSDFVSYDPRLPEHLQLFVKRFPRDNERIAEMESGVLRFLAEVDEMLAKLPQAETMPA